MINFVPRSFAGRFLAGLAALGFSAAMPVSAAIVIHGTRIVYQAAEPEVSIRLENAGTTPALTQVWIDDGDLSLNASEAEVPFILTPPMARVDPKKSQMVRILYSGDQAAEDQERLYWFNVLDIPPAVSEQSANKLQLAFRSRIKLFLRPAQMTEAVQDAPAKLSWRVASENTVTLHNGSKFHITFSSAVIKGTTSQLVFDDESMVAPGKTMTVRLKQGKARSGDVLIFNIVNDYGGLTAGEATLR